MTSVYRAPMRSRRDDIEPHAGVERGLRKGLCGFGRFDVAERRVERFAEVADGSFVWTRDSDGLYRLGRLTGPYFYDADGEGVDLVHVRTCDWRSRPFIEPCCPAAVVATFGRGGRNFQQIHDDRVGDESARLWAQG